MSKKIAVITITIIILAVISLYFYRDRHSSTPVPAPLPVNHKTDDSVSTDNCSREGVYIDAPADFSSVECCPGLVKTAMNGPVDENCKPIIPDNSPGYEPGSICLACGDSVCNDAYENKCNCAEDCK